jgi:hypothetical protein
LLDHREIFMRPSRFFVIAHVSGRQMVDCLHWGTAASGAAN